MSQVPYSGRIFRAQLAAATDVCGPHLALLSMTIICKVSEAIHKAMSHFHSDEASIAFSPNAKPTN